MRARPDCLGHLEVSPPLNAAEATYLRTLRAPARDDDASGRPAGPCCWAVCRDGCCLQLDPVGPSDGDEVAWLRWLIRELWRPGAPAGRSRRLRLDRFTCDHTVAGVVVAGLPDDGGLVAITVRDNRVTARLLGEAGAARERHAGRAVVVDLAVRRATRGAGDGWPPPA